MVIIFKKSCALLMPASAFYKHPLNNTYECKSSYKKKRFAANYDLRFRNVNNFFFKEVEVKTLIALLVCTRTKWLIRSELILISVA